MKVVLAAVNAKYIHSNPAVYSLRAYARKYRGEIHIAEYTINHSAEDILADLYSQKPDILAFSCYLWNIVYIRELAAQMHKLLPDTILWAGGPEVSYGAKAFLEENPYFTGVMCGEGEETFLELMDYYHGQGGHLLHDREDLRHIRGIAYLQDGIFRRTPDRPPLDMDCLPFLYEDLAPFENRIIYYESSRGCPFGCTYCLSSIEKKMRLRSFSLVKEELDFFLREKVAQVKFVDRTFNCNRRHAMDIWEYLAEHDNGVTNFHFEIAADLLTEEELRILSSMRPGLIQLEIGVQSANAGTIREIRRTMDFQKLKENVKAVKAMGNIHQHLDLIAGLPLEDYDSFAKSYQAVYEMEPDQLQLGFLKVLKGSPMHGRTGEYGMDYWDSPPYEVLKTRWLSYGELRKLKQVEEMTEVYYNSGQFSGTMQLLGREYDNPFDLYRELGEYYSARGLDGRSHSRLERYEILLAFIREKWPKKLPLYQDLLLLDLYRREKVKSRPSWARDQKLWKEEMMAFFRGEEERRQYLKDYEGFDARQMSKMAHVEIFAYPVTDKEEMERLRRAGEDGPRPNGDAGTDKAEQGDEAQTGYAVLFDYKKRNPLSRGAAEYSLGKWERGGYRDEENRRDSGFAG